MGGEANSNQGSHERWAALLVLAILTGLAIAWLDSRPGWDDTGITAGLVLLAAIAFTVLDPGRAWLWAPAVGIWIPITGIISSGNDGSLLALVIAFVGAGAAWLAVMGLRAAVGQRRA